MQLIIENRVTVKLIKTPPADRWEPLHARSAEQKSSVHRRILKCTHNAGTHRSCISRREI